MMLFESIRSATRYHELEWRRHEIMTRRRHDWRVGNIVYQVIVDRFAPSSRLKDKKEQYKAPRKLMKWSQKPKRRPRLEKEKVSGQEVEFWGGDLKSLSDNLDYIKDLGIDTLYLNPIFQAFTNHKYDAMDYFQVDPQYGTNQELGDLVERVHDNGMRLILDGVLNHMSRRAPMFIDAQNNPNSPYHHFFVIHEELNNGYRGWRKVANLPELNLENPAVRAFLYELPDSVVQYWIRQFNIDGWRLDVAPDLGFHHLSNVTQYSHAAKPGTVVIGECWNYPEEWLEVLDGVMNMHTREMILGLFRDQMTPTQFKHALHSIVTECDEEGLLMSHNVLDNHDLPRLATVLPNRKDRKLAQFLQFTLPGSPVVYYGTEYGAKGGHDPETRVPMDWEKANKKNADRKWLDQLVQWRKENPALRIGSTRVLETTDLIAYLRTTDLATESIIVVVNPTEDTVEEMIPVRDSRLMDYAGFECVVTGSQSVLHAGFITVKLPPKSAQMYRSVDRGNEHDYSMFKRVM